MGLIDGGDFESFFRAGIRRVSTVFKIVMEETLRISEWVEGLEWEASISIIAGFSWGILFQGSR